MPESSDVVAETVKALGAGPAAHEAYRDLLRPAAREIGKDLLTVAHVVHRVLAPLRGAVWCYDQISDWLSITLTQKLAHSNPKDIHSPDMTIAGPALLYLSFCKDKETLQDLFANLLASSMDATTKSAAHPSFVYIIQQMTPDEAKILRHLCRTHRSHNPIIRETKLIPEAAHYRSANDWLSSIRSGFARIVREVGCEVPQSGAAYLDNLLRLQLLEIVSFREMTDRHSVRSEVAQTETTDLVLTDFGFAFFKICIEGPPTRLSARR